MNATRRRLALLAPALLLLALALAGCGDPALWARWRSERALFHLRALERRLIARGATEGELVRLETGYRALLDAFPPERWAASGHGAARDVAIAAGEAGLARARSEARRGAHAEAERDLASLEPRVAALPGVLLGVRRARLAALERLGRFEEAGREREAVAAMDPLGEGGTAAPWVLDAALQLAAERRGLGDETGAVAALSRTEASFVTALARAGPAEADPLADALSELRAERGDAAGALGILRARLALAPPDQAPERIRLMASCALQAGAPESALAYSRWAASLDDSRRVAGLAWLAAARAFDLLGEPDSALARYDLVLKHWRDPAGLGPVARYRRAELLERTGQWPQASAEYNALAAVYPTHPLAFLSARQIVQHHLRSNEPELARVAGDAAIENLRRLLQTNRDPAVQLQAGAVEGDVLLALGRYDEAERDMLDLWRRFPDDSTAQAAALRAARLAEHRPGGVPRADSVRAALRNAATDATVRREARRESGVSGAR